MSQRYLSRGKLPSGDARQKHRGLIHKMGTVEEEADETLFWLELIARDGLLPKSKLEALMNGADEILSIVVSSIRTAKKRL